MRNRNTDAILKAGRVHLVALRDRFRTGLAGRSRQVLTITALAGVTSLGLIGANVDKAPEPATAVKIVNVSAERANVAERADRSTRTSTTASTATIAQAATTSVNKAAEQQVAAKPVAKPVAKPAAKAAPAPAWASPMKGAEVTSCYGQRWGALHAGIDFAKPEGTPITSIGSGTVVAAGWVYSGYGISVVVDHGNGYLTHYAHMSETKVHEGQKVKAGTTLGLEGSTGDSTGPHLHFEVHQGSMWNQIDPAGWLADHGVKVSC